MLGGALQAFGPMLAQLLGGGQVPINTAGPGGFMPTKDPNAMGPIPTTAGIQFPYAGGAMTATGTPDDANSDIPEGVVSGWKPKKRSTLGFLGDVLLGAFGAKPAFGERMQQRNLHSALEGFTHDPMESIRRIAQIPGMEGKALELYNTERDNARLDSIAQANVMTKREKIIGQANQLFGAVKPDGSNWPAIRQYYLKIMERNGINDVFLPEEFDPDLINANRAGGMTFSQQDLQQYRKDRLEQLGANVQSQIEHRKVQEQQGERRLGIQQQNANRPRGATPKPEFAARTVRIRDKSGQERVIEFSKDGKTAYHELPDGRIIKYDVQGPNLVRVDVK